jgi:hypothetical protein
MAERLKDSLNRARKVAKAEFDNKVVSFMMENPKKPHQIVAQLFGVHRNYVGKLSREILGPRKRGRKPRGAANKYRNAVSNTRRGRT